nr:GAF domain-containing protein [Angustibacter aerolatus]
MLGDVADRAQRLVPSCVGVSVTVLVDDRPYTLTSTSDEIAVLDGAQYVDGGPCVDAARTLDQVDVLDVLDEQRWTLFARAAGASGVRSTLSMPLYAAGSRLPGAINLYASEPDAFAGSRDEPGGGVPCARREPGGRRRPVVHHPRPSARAYPTRSPRTGSSTWRPASCSPSGSGRRRRAAGGCRRPRTRRTCRSRPSPARSSSLRA